MRRLVILCVSTLILVGCGASTRELLDRADSLAVEQPDSALKILRMIDSSSLWWENEAHYALVKTTALYKSFAPIESDSLINIAVRYYTDHFDQGKLTDALMYRGAIYADYMNFERMAIDSYKDAEEIADTADLMTIGLLNFRIGELYQNSNIDHSEPIARYRRAVDCFRTVGHEAFENYSYSYLGQMYITENYDSAYYYITKAIDWASKQNDQLQLLNSSRVNLSKLYWCHDKDPQRRKELLLEVYRQRDHIAMGADVYHHLADVYCDLGNIDSAKFYAAHYPAPQCLSDTMSYHMMLESLAVAQNDYKTAYQSKKVVAKSAGEIITRGNAKEYYAIDKQYDNKAANAKVEKLNNERVLHIYLIIIISLTLGAFVCAGVVLWKRKRKAIAKQYLLIEQLQESIERQKVYAQGMFDRNVDIIENLNKTIDERNGIELSLKKIVSDRMKMMRDLLTVNHMYGNHPAKFLRQFNEIVSINKKSTDQCDAIIDVANQLHNNIIDIIATQHQNISYADKLLLSLVCMEFSPVEIKVFLDLPTTDAVYMAKSRLKKKLGVASIERCFDNLKGPDLA